MVLVEKDPYANVKLSFVDQERSLDVFLDDESVVLDLACV